VLRLSNICINLTLALIPVILGLLIGWLSWRDTKFSTKWYLWVPLIFLWVGFLPNTCYLLTEWRHFIDIITQNPEQIRQAPKSKEALLDFLALSTFYVVYSSLGLLTFSMALWPVAHWLKPQRWAKFLFFLICALGVYLGLIKRLNTWDVWNHPHTVLNDSVIAVSHPFTVAMIILFSLVIWANYWVFEVFIDGFQLRLRRIKKLNSAV
jgi:uncharacterized membrane protein